MKKAYAAILFLVLSLCACGQKAPAQPAETEPPAAAETAAAPGNAKETAARPEAEAGKAENGKTGNAALAEKPDTKEAAASYGQETVPPALEVENNGGNYVRVGSEVYFRKYGPEALDPSAFYGRFTKYWDPEGGESEIMAFDLLTGEAERRFSDTGHGPLWYSGGSFWLQETLHYQNYVYRYSPDGAEAEELCEGQLIGITGDGILAVSDYELTEQGTFGTRYTFYKDGVRLSDHFAEGNYLTAGLDENGLYLIELPIGKSGTDSCVLFQLQTDGTVLELGSIKAENYYLPNALPGGFVSGGSRIGLGLDIYDGSLSEIEGQLFIEAAPGVADSAKEIQAEGHTGGRLLYPAISGDGKIGLTEHLPDELRINSEGGKNDLERWDGEQWLKLKESFLPLPEPGGAKDVICQDMEYVDGIAFITAANACVSPVEALGPREVYKLLGLDYLAVLAENRVKSFACMEMEAECYGNVWFTEDGSQLCWQQLASDDYEEDAEACYLLEIADDAIWDDGREAVLDGAAVLNAVPMAYQQVPPELFAETGTAQSGGCPLPEEAGVPVFLHLNRNGRVSYLSRRFPNALLKVEIGEEEEELKEAKETIEPSRRVTDEDTPWYWAKVTALADGVKVCLERTPDHKNILDEFAEYDGLFVPGSELYSGSLDKGEYLAVKVSLPWHPEMRLSAAKGELYGSYIFGEDNYMHLEREDGTIPEKTIAGYAKEEAHDLGGEALKADLAGTWLYPDAEGGGTAALISFYEDAPEAGGSIRITRGDESQYTLKTELGRLYADTYEEPDLLMLETCDAETEELINMKGAAGDYRIERYRTDGQEILHLIQANNGDGALGALLPAEENRFDYTFVRHTGTAASGPVRRNAEFSAVAVRYDKDRNTIWLTEAEEVDEYPGGGYIYGAVPDAECLEYPLTGMEAFSMLRGLGDPEYPMTVFRVNTDPEGSVTVLLPEY